MTAILEPAVRVPAHVGPPVGEDIGVRIEQAILHLTGQDLRLSQRPVDLAETPDFARYLAEHVAVALHDPATRTAAFEPAADGPVAVCRSLLGGERDLVDASHDITRRLWQAINGDRRVTPAVFAVLVCRTATADDLVALLKLDPGPVFQHEWRTDEDGRSYLSAHRVPDAMPTVREGLQKAAFVVGVDPTRADHLRVLDRQVRRHPAGFFLVGFLGATALPTSAELTRGLYTALWAARDSFAASDVATEDRVGRFEAIIDGVFGMEAVDLDPILRDMHDEERNAIVRELDGKHLAHGCAFDTRVLGQLTKKMRYKGDHELRVEADARFFGGMVHDSVTAGRHTVTITTRKWRRA